MKICDIAENQVIYDVKQTINGPIMKEYIVTGLMKPIAIFVDDCGVQKKLYISELENLLTKEEAESQYKILEDYYIKNKDSLKFIERYKSKNYEE